MTGTKLVRSMGRLALYRDNAYSTKKEAQKKAEYIRKKGDGARIFHNKYEGYVVYWYTRYPRKRK